MVRSATGADTQVAVVDGAGHSVQGDRALDLTALIRGFAAQPE
ncbi:hypothetical protein [Nocardia sp. NPDC049707]